MKFELEPYHRNTPDNELLADLIRVAKLLEKDSVTKKDYDKLGRFGSTTFIRRFGSWFKALEKTNLRKTRNLGLSNADLIDDLIRVSNLLGKDSVTTNDYAKQGVFSTSTLCSRFGSWFKALERAGLKKTRNLGITEGEYFENIEEVWIRLGRQPHRAEMQKPLSRFSAGAYEYRFGSWRKALEKFVEYINQEEASISSPKNGTHVHQEIEEPLETAYRHKTKRAISNRLRFRVLMRDNFKCKTCGRSPAFDSTIVLHIDHIMPWSKGGETVIGNLQTLCSTCNIGKGDLEQSGHAEQTQSGDLS